MSYSKIFSGDLPELTYEVIKYFQNDFSTLYSCVLVNRLWCRLAIPLLWENPFLIRSGNCNFIEIYLHNLNDDLKTKLNDKIINTNSLFSNTLFNYPSFLKYLNTYRLTSSVGEWSINLKPISNFISLIQMIQMSLVKIFIEHEVNLHTLEIESLSTYYNIYYDSIIELILQNTNFIRNIRNINLDIINYSKLIKNRVLQAVNSQQNLKKILIDDSFPLFQSLLSKDYNFSNTLNTIVFYCIDFKGINNLRKIFEQLNVLESVHIFQCYSLNTDFTQQIINLTKPFKLKTLFINEISQIESLQLLLQKSGNCLENFGIGISSNPSYNQQLLELIIKYCKNIKFFDFQGSGNPQMLNLIENIRQNLNYLLIHINEVSNGILQNLGQILPSKLEYLSLYLNFKEDDFRVFLENSKNIFINKLLIMQIGKYDILHYIKEYIMKEKKIKYLAIWSMENGDLSDFEDEVKEFKSYNIKVRSISDLYLSTSAVYDIVKYRKMNVTYNIYN